MRTARRARLATFAGAALVAVAGCGSPSTSTSTAPTSSGRPAASTTTAISAASGRVTVFAAASLTEAFTHEQATLRTEAPGLDVTFSFAGSQVLVQQLQQGAPADVVATADERSMAALVRAGLVEAPTVFAHNRLEILVRPGNPAHVSGLADLARRDLVVVLCDGTVPAGRYSADVLAAAGVAVSPRSLEPDVKSAVRKVTSGEADATIVYVTDVKAAGAKGTGVVVPDAQNALANYPVAVVKGTHHRAAAEAFVQALVHGSGQQALRAQGFLPGDR